MSKNTKEIVIKIEGEEWTKKVDAAFTKANKKAKIAGFRPGKAPRDLFIKQYGEQSLFMDAAENSVNDAYAKALNDIEGDIVAQPEMNITSIDKNGVEFKFTFTMKPDVKLGEYKKLKVKKEVAKATKEEIENEIKNMRSRYAENVTKEGTLEKDDTAIIDFEGFKDGVAFEGGKGENYSLTIGSNTFIPGFEDKLIGMKKDEVRDIELTFPEDYHSEDLKGKDVVFKVKLNEIKTTVIPELNEEFFADLALEGVNSKETLEAEVKKNIIARKEMEIENKYIDDLLEAAAKNIQVDIPEVMIDEESHRMVHQYEDTLKMQGLSLEQFYQFTNSNEEKLKEQMKGEATNRVKYRLMLEKIAEEEKIEITEEDANKEAEEMAKKYNMEKDKFLELFGGLEMIKYDLKMRKAIEVLKGE